MSDLKLRDLRKSFGSVDVIKGVDLEIKSKEFIAFVGPSGSGKSTLLRMIAGLEDITSGDLEIDSKRVNDVDPSKRSIAMVFQSYALYPHMTVRENMGFALRFAGASRDEINSRVDKAARILELQPLMNRKPKELSGGQRQRVAIGRAIVREPGVFLFDEPLSNLDAELRVHMRIEIARLHKELQTTIIYVTHDQVEAMTLADRIVVLRGGQIEQVGTPLELYDDPDNLFVAGFIGSPKMNFLAGVVDASGRNVVLSDGSSQTIPISTATAQKPGTSLTVGLRPEAFSEGGSAVLELQIEIVEHLGGETYAYARFGNAGELLTIATGNDRNLASGSPYVGRFDPTVALYFDTQGKRIR